MSILDIINNTSQSPKFSGVFGASVNSPLYSYQGFGVWNKNYNPTASAFERELKSKGFLDIYFSLQKVAGFPTQTETFFPSYNFYGTIRSDYNASQLQQTLETYFGYYFDSLRLDIQQQTFPNTASGYATRKVVFTFSGNNLINAPVIANKINSLGYQNTLVVGTGNTITVTTEIPQNVTDALAKNNIQNIINTTPKVQSAINNTINTISGIPNQIYTSSLPIAQQAQALANAAQTEAIKTGKTINQTLSELTNGAINSVEELQKQVANGTFSLDFTNFNSFLKTFAIGLGISQAVAICLLVVGGLIFLKFAK